MKILQQLWNDERGAIFSMELILIATLVVIGIIVGLATLRDSVVGELGDTAAAVGQVNQSYDIQIGDSSNTTANSELTIVDSNGATPGGTVTVTMGFTTIATPRVLVTSTFENYFYADATEKGDGQDTAGAPPAGIVIAGAGAPGTAGEASIPAVIP